METVSLKSYCQANNIKAVGTIYASKENGYPMVALESDGEVQHLMLTKAAGEKWSVGTNPIEFARDASVTTFMHPTLNVEVSRLSTGSTSVSVDDLF